MGHSSVISVGKVFDWVQRKMLTEPLGRFGMYERWRIDFGTHTDWVRPGCNLEIARALMSYEFVIGSKKYEDICENLLNWVLNA